ncbi:MAG TPA: LytTR family DNA-binding domain-containing protein [Longimicrobium sp.]|jgi:two-component system LytT family response regulator|nr:LytTR family DNA-binding domain-containing protein [Longimicrobium sp.]
MIRTLVVDDEALSRERLATLLAREPDVQLLGECAGGRDAVTRIRELRPDLVFLDVQMPEVDGFQVVAQLDPENAPAVVFATAYDEFALRAFDAAAADYLLKPIGPERLAVTLDRVRARLPAGHAAAPLDPRVTSLLEGLANAGEHRERFAVRTGGRFVIVRADEIVLVEAADNYVRLHTARETHLFRATMAEMERMLDPRRFLRIHRSAIIAVEQVRTIEPWGLGEHQFVLADGTRLTSSRAYRKAIRTVFGC